MLPSDEIMGSYVEFKGRLAKIIGHNGSQLAYYFEYVEPDTCENCGHNLGKKQFDIIRSSPLWDQNVKPVATLRVSGEL